MEPKICFEQLQQFANGDTAVELELAELFIGEALECQNKLVSAVTEKNNGQVKYIIHQLKGLSGCAGAKGIVELILDLETRLCNCQTHCPIVKELVDMIMSTIQTFENHVIRLKKEVSGM